MLMTVLRYDPGENNTIGLWLIDGRFQCYSIEDKDRGLRSDMSEATIAQMKIPKQTAIPTGTYKVAWTKSTRFGIFLPELMNVKGYTGIRIHAANSGEDVEGCIGAGEIAAQDTIQVSKVALAKLLPKIESACALNDCWVNVWRLQDVAVMPVIPPQKL